MTVDLAELAAPRQPERPVAIAPGSPGATLLEAFGPEPADLVLSRWHGVGRWAVPTWTRRKAAR